MKSNDVQRALIGAIDTRAKLAVPNVSWGLVNWGECDLLVMSGSGYLTEYEIKVSAADIKREWKKDRWTIPGFRNQFNNLIKEYYMAVPAKLVDVVKETMPPDIGGGIVVADFEFRNRSYEDPRVTYPDKRAKWIQSAKTNSRARKLTDKEQYQMARLGTLRYWSLFKAKMDHGKKI